jgi:hypothetical protein
VYFLDIGLIGLNLNFFRRLDTQHDDIQHNDTKHKGLIYDAQHMTLGVTTLCHYPECGILFVVMLSVTMGNVVMLSAVALFCEVEVGLPFKILSETETYCRESKPRSWSNSNYFFLSLVSIFDFC